MSPRPTIQHFLDTFVVERFAVMQRGLRSPRGKDIVIGQGATVVGGIDCGQSLYIAKDTVVRGPLRAAVDIVIGSRVTVEGGVEAGSNVLCLDGSLIQGEIRAKGNVRLHTARVEGNVDVGGDVIIQGETRLRDIQTKGRIVVLEPPVDGHEEHAAQSA